MHKKSPQVFRLASLFKTRLKAPKKHFPPWAASQSPLCSVSASRRKLRPLPCSAASHSKRLRLVSRGNPERMCGNAFSSGKNISPHPLRRRMGGSNIDRTVHWSVPRFLMLPFFYLGIQPGTLVSSNRNTAGYTQLYVPAVAETCSCGSS